MTNDHEFATHLRERIAVIAPDVSVDTSVVVPGGRRRQRVTGLAGAAAVSLVLAGGGWVAASAAGDPPLPPAESTDEWTAPPWFAEQAAAKAEFRDSLQACVDTRGWEITVNEWGGSDENFGSDQARMYRFVADVNDCSATLGRPAPGGSSEAVTRELYPMLVDTWECVAHHGYEVPPPPSEDELVRQYETDGSDGSIWNPYGDLRETNAVGVVQMAELETTCPLPW